MEKSILAHNPHNTQFNNCKYMKYLLFCNNSKNAFNFDKNI